MANGRHRRKHHLATHDEWITQVVPFIKLVLWVILEVVRVIQTLHGQTDD